MTQPSHEEALEKIRKLQGYILSNVFPTGTGRAESVRELMRLKRTISKRKKDAEKP